MSDDPYAGIRERLVQEKEALTKRVDLIHAHARNPLEADSSEQAAQIGNVAVVSALESEATVELGDIDAALQRLDAGTYGSCADCGENISLARLEARPAATLCVDCAEASAPR
jgi:RNA polymerase-binding protein DksA